MSRIGWRKLYIVFSLALFRLLINLKSLNIFYILIDKDWVEFKSSPLY